MKLKVTGHPKFVTFADFMSSETDDSEGYLQQLMFMTKLPFTSVPVSLITSAEFWGHNNHMNSFSMYTVCQR
jgi:hypothetical protein